MSKLDEVVEVKVKDLHYLVDCLMNEMTPEQIERVRQKNLLNIYEKQLTGGKTDQR